MAVFEGSHGDGQGGSEGDKKTPLPVKDSGKGGGPTHGGGGPKPDPTVDKAN